MDKLFCPVISHAASTISRALISENTITTVRKNEIKDIDINIPITTISLITHYSTTYCKIIILSLDKILCTSPTHLKTCTYFMSLFKQEIRTILHDYKLYFLQWRFFRGGKGGAASLEN